MISAPWSSSDFFAKLAEVAAEHDEIGFGHKEVGLGHRALQSLVPVADELVPLDLLDVRVRYVCEGEVLLSDGQTGPSFSPAGSFSPNATLTSVIGSNAMAAPMALRFKKCPSAYICVTLPGSLFLKFFELLAGQRLHERDQRGLFLVGQIQRT